MTAAHTHRNASIAEIVAEMDRRGEEIARLREALAKIERAPAWGYPDKWETTPAEVRQIARAALNDHTNNCQIASDLDLLGLLRECREACLFDDDDGKIGVSEDAVISSELFDRICAAINKAEGLA